MNRWLPLQFEPWPESVHLLSLRRRQGDPFYSWRLPRAHITGRRSGKRRRQDGTGSENTDSCRKVTILEPGAPERLIGEKRFRLIRPLVTGLGQMLYPLRAAMRVWVVGRRPFQRMDFTFG